MRSIFTPVNLWNAAFGGAVMFMTLNTFGALIGLTVGFGLVVTISLNVASAYRAGVETGKSLR